MIHIVFPSDHRPRLSDSPMSSEIDKSSDEVLDPSARLYATSVFFWRSTTHKVVPSDQMPTASATSELTSISLAESLVPLDSLYAKILAGDSSATQMVVSSDHMSVGLSLSESSENSLEVSRSPLDRV